MLKHAHNGSVASGLWDNSPTLTLHEQVALNHSQAVEDLHNLTAKMLNP